MKNGYLRNNREEGLDEKNPVIKRLPIFTKEVYEVFEETKKTNVPFEETYFSLEDSDELQSAAFSFFLPNSVDCIIFVYHDEEYLQWLDEHKLPANEATSKQYVKSIDTKPYGSAFERLWKKNRKDYNLRFIMFGVRNEERKGFKLKGVNTDILKPKLGDASWISPVLIPHSEAVKNADMIKNYGIERIKGNNVHLGFLEGEGTETDEPIVALPYVARSGSNCIFYADAIGLYDIGLNVKEVVDLGESAATPGVTVIPIDRLAINAWMCKEIYDD